MDLNGLETKQDKLQGRIMAASQFGASLFKLALVPMF